MMPLASSSAIVALLITSHLVAPSSSISQADVDSVCADAPNHSFCSSYLLSIPNLSSASFKSVCATAITTATSSAQTTVEHIQVLAGQTSDRGLKLVLASCSEHYSEAVGDLGNAQQSLSVDDPDSANSGVVAARLDVDLCQKQIEGTIVVLQKDYDDFNNYCSISLSLLNHIS